jgi:hypothetical protein
MSRGWEKSVAVKVASQTAMGLAGSGAPPKVQSCPTLMPVTRRPSGWSSPGSWPGTGRTPERSLHRGSLASSSSHAPANAQSEGGKLAHSVTVVDGVPGVRVSSLKRTSQLWALATGGPAASRALAERAATVIEAFLSTGRKRRRQQRRRAARRAIVISPPNVARPLTTYRGLRPGQEKHEGLLLPRRPGGPVGAGSGCRRGFQPTLQLVRERTAVIAWRRHREHEDEWQAAAVGAGVEQSDGAGAGPGGGAGAGGGGRRRKGARVACRSRPG